MPVIFALPRALARPTLILYALLGTALTGCSNMSQLVPDYTPNFTWIYKIDIQQGVVVTQEMAAQLKPGMTREQVRFVLGSPAISDVFHADRWDYPYTFQKRGGTIEIRKYTVVFQDNRLKSFGGDPLPSEKDFDAGGKIVGVASEPRTDIQPVARPSGVPADGPAATPSAPTPSKSPAGS